MKRYKVTINSTWILTSLIVISLIVICNSVSDFPAGMNTGGMGDGFNAPDDVDGSSLNSVSGDEINDPVADDVKLGGEIANGGSGDDDEIGGGENGSGGDDDDDIGDVGEGVGGDDGIGGGEDGERGDDEGDEDEEEDEDEPSICMSTSQLISLIETITDLIEESVRTGEPYNPLEDPQVYQFWQ